MILFVIYKQPAGAIWLYFSFYGLRAEYISKRYIVIEEGNQGGAPWTMVLRRWNDGDHAMTHKMEIECVKEHIRSHYICM
jgi:hypothetical protein